MELEYIRYVDTQTQTHGNLVR